MGIETDGQGAPRGRSRDGILRAAGAFALIAALWLAADVATKAYFNGFALGSVVGGPYLGIFQFRLVHNTGMAWGLFGDSTFALGVMSVVVCAVLTGFFLANIRRITALELVGLALVVAGGIGNALDRFTLGYVVDFIETTFIDFPVFNVADIGVTCGFILFLLGLLLSFKASEASSEGSAQPEGSKGSKEEGR